MAYTKTKTNKWKCTSVTKYANYHHIGQCAPKCGNCKRYGHTTTDCQVKTNNNNNNKNQKVGACYECGNTRHIKKNCPNLKNHRNGNGDDVAQGRAYVLGGRDASPDSNVITDMFLLNNRYASILFDTGADMSFVSTTFSALIDITPTTLENHYDIELAEFVDVFLATIFHEEAQRQASKPAEALAGRANSRAPYQLAPSEMKELAEKLQELPKKGFIRPNSSP
ncbi:putative reverse transcriptase domain-containing protein [Tanacetum coccineum]